MFLALEMSRESKLMEYGMAAKTTAMSKVE